MDKVLVEKIKALLKLVGFSPPYLATMDVYGHLMPSVYSSSVDALDNIFEKKPRLRLVQ